MYFGRLSVGDYTFMLSVIS